MNFFIKFAVLSLFCVVTLGCSTTKYQALYNPESRGYLFDSNMFDNPDRLKVEDYVFILDVRTDYETTDHFFLSFNSRVKDTELQILRSSLRSKLFSIDSVFNETLRTDILEKDDNGVYFRARKILHEVDRNLVLEAAPLVLELFYKLPGQQEERSIEFNVIKGDFENYNFPT